MDPPFGPLFLLPAALVRRSARLAWALGAGTVGVAGTAVVALAVPGLPHGGLLAVALWAVAALRAMRLAQARRLDRAYRLDALVLRQRLPEAVLQRCLASQQHLYSACIALRALGVARLTPAELRRPRLAALYAPAPPWLPESLVLLGACSVWIALAPARSLALATGVGMAALLLAGEVALGAAALALRDGHEAYLDALAAAADAPTPPDHAATEAG